MSFSRNIAALKAAHNNTSNQDLNFNLGLIMADLKNVRKVSFWTKRTIKQLLIVASVPPAVTSLILLALGML